MNLKEIDDAINSLLCYLESIQNIDGSFDTMYLQPYYNKEKGWMKFSKNAAFDTATVLIPLLQIKNDLVSNITKRGIGFIKDQSYKKKIWSYPSVSNEYLHFFDSDSTSLCSYVLEKNGGKIDNKLILSSLMNRNKDYLVYIVPKFLMFQLSLSENIKLWFHNQKVKKKLAYKNNLLNEFDCDFVVTCNTLLYLGKSKETYPVFDNVSFKIKEDKFNLLYYPSIFHGIYSYSRMCNHLEKQIKDNIFLVNKYVKELKQKKLNEVDDLEYLLLVNSFFYLDTIDENVEDFFAKCFSKIISLDYKIPYPYYSCNRKTDTQPGTNLPNTYFGSPAITCSLYLEFLNLYRKRFYGAYYGEE
jgi:hypothetical protein